ncbi:hypothetical protein MKEN_01022700 [Mycena kentingensis (nom. inval.)]|nr:hypothetical protein MKEN_01022700 [Mycena kentingensis (nom. inval.)]
MASKRKEPADSSTQSPPNKRSRPGVNERREPDNSDGPVPGPSTSSSRGERRGEKARQKDAERAEHRETERLRRKRRQLGIAADDVPEEALDTQTSFQYHIRALAGLFTQTMVLGRADEFIAYYDRRFEKVGDLAAHIRELCAECRAPCAEARRQAQNAIREVERLAKEAASKKKRRGKIVGALSAIPKAHFEFMFEAVARVGLKRFYPDVFGAARSPYNQRLRHIAVSTFQSIVSWFGYNEEGASIEYSEDTGMLNDFYDNFVFGTIAENSRRVEKSPNSLENKALMDATISRRGRLAERRYAHAKAIGCRKAVLRALKNPACHSDDEEIVPDEAAALGSARAALDPDADCRFQAHETPWCNPGFTLVKRQLDRGILEKWERSPPKQRGRKPEGRKTSVLLPPSSISKSIPPAVFKAKDKEYDTPLDVFSPQYFNTTLDIEERARYGYQENGIAFALPEMCVDQTAIDAWKGLRTKDFMTLYGNDVQDLYRIPTEEELAAHRLHKDAEDSDDDSGTELNDTDVESDGEPELMQDEE